MTGDDVVREAAEWLGTPWHPQASLKRKGADCKGLVWGVARELGLPEGSSPWAAISDYGPIIPVDTLKQGLAETMQRVTGEMRPGDVLLLNQGGKAQHLGIYAGKLNGRSGERLIHTWPSVGRVDATSLAGALMIWPVASVWRFKSLEQTDGV